MTNVNKTLYIPLYGKSFVSKKGIILNDEKAEEIWSKVKEEVGNDLKGKSKSKYLAYYMGMRAAIFDNWINEKINDYLNKNNNDSSSPDNIVIHLGCGMDSRCERISRVNRKDDSSLFSSPKITWFDVDFPEVIEERKKYYSESEYCRMISADARQPDWISALPNFQNAIIIMEGISMYLTLQEIQNLFQAFSAKFPHINLLLDCYTTFAAKASRIRNPINDVGVTIVHGIDDPKLLEENATSSNNTDTSLPRISFIREHEITPSNLTSQLHGIEKYIFKSVYAGSLSKKMYRLYEFEK